MARPYRLKDRLQDNVKDGALAVMNAHLSVTETGASDWSEEQKAKYALIMEVQDEVLKRVRKSLKIL